MALTFLRCQITIFSELQGEVGRGFLFFQKYCSCLRWCWSCSFSAWNVKNHCWTGLGLGRFGLGFRLVHGISQGGVFMGNFCLEFPVTGIDGLGKDVETREGFWLVVNHVVLDVFARLL